MYLFTNPIFECFISSYIEETQKAINEYVSLDQFKKQNWNRGLPNFAIDLLGYLTG